MNIAYRRHIKKRPVRALLGLDLLIVLLVALVLAFGGLAGGFAATGYGGLAVVALVFACGFWHCYHLWDSLPRIEKINRQAGWWRKSEQFYLIPE